MIPAKLIEKKRDGFELSAEEIEWFVEGTVEDKIDDCQLSAMLMAIYFNGMSDKETFSLVSSMVNSGEKFKFNNIDNYVADKHSTGGIGDKISFILAPISVAISSSAGAIILQGPHHSAQKSTRTGCPASRTLLPKSSSETLTVVICGTPVSICRVTRFHHCALPQRL